MTTDELRELYRLKNIIRYNTRSKIKTESVAEHSFYVAIIALKLCDEYGIDSITTRDIVIKALLHDMPEIEINDITYDAKERLNLRPYLKKYEDDYYDRRFPKYAKLMKKSSTLVQLIVDTADAMSVIQYANNEISLGNNSAEMQQILDESKVRVENYLKKLNKFGGKKDEKNK